MFGEAGGAFGALPGWFCVAVAAYEVDPKDADQPGGDERLDGAGGCAGAVMRGQLAGHGAAVMRADPAFALCGAGDGAGETA